MRQAILKKRRMPEGTSPFQVLFCLMYVNQYSLDWLFLPFLERFRRTLPPPSSTAYPYFKKQGSISALPVSLFLFAGIFASLPKLRKNLKPFVVFF